jgi:hypothetical protein
MAWETSPATSSVRASHCEELLASSKAEESPEARTKMKAALSISSLFSVACGILLLSCQSEPKHESEQAAAPSAYLGLDRNIFPDATALPMLRDTFSFVGYWLSPPPGETKNTWTGQRQGLRSLGFGFLLLYRGPLTRDLKTTGGAAQSGTRDAQRAAIAARHEGFPVPAIIFVDIEEGGRLSDKYHAYLRAWTVRMKEEGYRAGAYCSGIPVKEGPGATITTADDIHAHLGAQDFSYFIFNDGCPPSPGCVFPAAPPAPATGGIPFAGVWQFVRSPRTEFSAHCPPGYHNDGNCYAPNDAAHTWFLDVSSATSSDPSNGR